MQLIEYKIKIKISKICFPIMIYIFSPKSKISVLMEDI